MTAPHAARPVVWSIAGTDSGGGAGLSADQRTADAFGVHLCPVVAAVTAQNSLAVTRIERVSPLALEAQLQALADDLPPQVVKTGLLGGVEHVRLVAHWIDRLRRRHPVALVVDPVLAASTGAAFADASMLAAYRELLLPRATLITPNRREAAALLGQHEADPAGLPTQALELRRRGAQAVCITGGDAADLDGRVLDWMATEQADGWLAAPRIATEHHHGSGCTFATSAAAALALGFVPADAVVLAKMATGHALRHGHPAGAGRGPVRATSGFATGASLLPWLSCYENIELAVRQVFKGDKSRSEMRDWIEHNLALVHMTHARDKRPSEISGGMKQRIGIARALAMQPKVLLMDEPFGALDALTRAHLQDSLMEIHADLGNTVIMITHDVDEAVLLSDRIVMMSNGPAASVGEILHIELERPRERIAMAHDTRYHEYRAAVLEFLYQKQVRPAA